MEKSNVLVVWMPSDQICDERIYRDYVLESLRTGVLILPSEVTLEVMEFPTLGDVTVVAEQTEPAAEKDQSAPPVPEPESEGEEKRKILQRLKDYQAANGLGSLEAVSVKTAHQKGQRLSAETLRYLCADGAPKLPMEDWRKINRALDKLEEKERNAPENEQRGS